MTHPTTQTALSAKAWVFLGLLAGIWGASFLSNRVALTEVGVLTTVAFRVSGAAVLLWVYVIAKNLPVPKGRRDLGAFFGMGVLNNVIPFTLIVWGQQHIASGLAGILNSTTAIFTVLLVPVFFADERLTMRKAVGVALGFVGVATTIGIANLTDLDPTSLGQIAILAAAFSYAVSAVFARVMLKGIRPEVSAAGMLTAAALVMVPAAFLTEGTPTLAYGPATWTALAYLAFIASALAYILYYRILSIAGAGNLSLVTLLIPPFAIALGALVYRETLAVEAYLGFALIAAGLLIIDGRLEKMLLNRA
ncbi:MAG: DMT family transporter [Paracoccaceae bacterium]|nr:DMT family transporter [Paracoccaceae bacterium]